MFFENLHEWVLLGFCIILMFVCVGYEKDRQKLKRQLMERRNEVSILKKQRDEAKNAAKDAGMALLRGKT
jgi:hypothetical protein